MTFWHTLKPETNKPKVQSVRKAGLARRCFQLAFVLVIIGATLGLLALWGQRRAAAAAVWRNPADNIQVAAVARDLALLSLAGVPDAQVLTLAIETGELATTHALLALSVDLADVQRMNGWLWLAHRHHAIGQDERAAQAYRMAAGGAILGPDVPDLLRVETLLAAGQGLTELHDKANARFFLKQAAIIGTHSPHLTTYHRRSLLERLVPASLQAGGERDDWSTLARAVKNDTAKGGNFGAPPSPKETEWRGVTPDLDVTLVQARDARRAAAAEWLGNRPTDADDTEGSTQNGTERIEALRAALQAEEAAMNRAAERKAGEGASGLATTQAQLRWLSLKRRIAAGGFGPNLMPEWESDRDVIESALVNVWTDWLALQADRTDVGFAAGYQARQAIMAAYWGLFPEAPMADLLPVAQSTHGLGNLRLTIVDSEMPLLVGWSE